MTRLYRYEVIGIFVIAAISILLGSIFLNYNTNNFVSNLLLPNSNSLWQGGKLMVISMLIYSILEYIIFGYKYPSFFFAKGAAILVAAFIFVLGSYFFDITFGTVIDWAHYSIYFIAIILGQWLSYYFMQKQFYYKLVNVYGIITILLVFFVFVMYSSKSFNSPIFSPKEQYKSIIKNV
jgi:hypothetical protein